MQKGWKMQDYFRPQPKPKRVRLKGKDYAGLRLQLFRRANGRCETCGKWAPLTHNGVFNRFKCGHVSHKRHGSNKEDTLEATLYECHDCHMMKHSPKWSPILRYY